MTPDPSTLIDHNQMQQFQKWFYEAGDLYDEREPNAISLTTIGADQYPKNSMVLLKKYTWEGFIFFTNYKSDKGKAISPNPGVWASQQSQVVASQEVLKNSLTRFEAQLKDKEIPIHLNIY